jgi:hypothetical protein
LQAKPCSRKREITSLHSLSDPTSQPSLGDLQVLSQDTVDLSQVPNQMRRLSSEPTARLKRKNSGKNPKAKFLPITLVI